MAKHNGYFSQKGFELYDTTGTTEDWSYNATGGFGFTFEIYCGAPNYATGDCDEPAFHPRYATMVKEWDGDERAGRPRQRPRAERRLRRQGQPRGVLPRRREHDRRGAPLGARGRGAGRHAAAADQGLQDRRPTRARSTVDDRLETVYDVGAAGTFRWHVNPSTRPIVAKETGDAERRAAERARPASQGSPTGTADDPTTTARSESPTRTATTTANYNDHPLTIPADGDNAVAEIRVAVADDRRATGTCELYRDANGDGKSQRRARRSSAASQQGTTDFEEIMVPNPSGQVRAARQQLRARSRTTR